MKHRKPTNRILAPLFAAALAIMATGTEAVATQPPATDSAATQPAAVETTPLVMAISTEPSTLDAQLVNDRSSRIFTSNIYEPLLFRQRDNSIAPHLATSYENVDENTWRFKLRDDVTFHDGEPFNAEAVVFSIERIINEEFDTQRSSYIDGITGAKAVDATTVDITTDGLLATLPIQLTQIPMVPPTASDKLDTNPIGTGPYKFVEWQPGTQISATRNDQYWGDKPSIKDFVVRIVGDSQTALSALQSGEVDLVVDLLPEQRSQITKSLSVPAAEFSYIAFNTYLPALKDPRVRVALNMAVDKQTLADSVYEGNAQPNHAQNLSEGMLGYNPDLQPIAYDPEGAKKLLEEAGFDFGTTLKLNVPVGRYLKGEETAEYVAAQWAEIGVNAEINAIEFSTFREEARIKGTEPGAMDLKYGWNSNEFGDGSRILSHITCKGGSSKICIPKVDELMRGAAETLDNDQRAKDYQQVWAILRDDPYAVYLLQQNLIYGLSDRLQWEPRVDDEYYVSTMSLTA